jgi:hypothetical protein
MEAFELSVIRAIEDRCSGGQPTPKAWPRQEQVAPTCTVIDTQLPSLPREQQGGEWKVIESRKNKKKKKAKKAIDRAAGSQVNSAGKSTTDAQPKRQTDYAPKPKDAASTGTPTKTPKGASVSTPRKAVLPRSPRSSAVTLTLSEEAKMSYAEALTTPRGKIPLAEIGIEKMKMCKAMTGAIVLEVFGDKDREKASALATRLAMMKVAAPARMAELRLDGIDISHHQGRAAECIGAGRGMRRCGSPGRGDCNVQRWSWLGSGALPIGRGEEACPDGKDYTGMVHCKARSHRQEALAVF